MSDLAGIGVGMDKAGIEKFAHFLGTKIQPSARQGWLTISCPMASWRHQKGHDKNPSFGIKIDANKAASRCHCFSCNFSGDLHDLLLELQLNRSQLPEAIKLGPLLQLIAQMEVELPLSLGDVGSYEDEVLAGPQKPFVFSERWLKSFPKAYEHPYLSERGVSSAVAEKMDFRFDGSRDRICVPVRDFSGALVGLHGRSLVGAEPKYLMYTFKQKTNPEIWLGEHWIDFNCPVVVTESVFDLAKVLQVYGNTVCPLSAGFGARKAQRLSAALQIVTLFDQDKAGDAARKKLGESLKDSDITHVLWDGPAKDAGDLNVETIRGFLVDHVPVEWGSH